MRSIGTIADETAARQFADYLMTQGISTRLDRSAEGVAVWVHKEDLLPRARQELEAFRQDPSDPKYAGASKQAEALRRRAAAADREHARRTVDLRGKLGNPVLMSGLVTRTLIVASVALFVLEWVYPYFELIKMRYLLFTVWFQSEDGQVSNLGMAPIASGQVWRLVTPIFFHANPLHLLFNMMMTLRIGRLIEARRGSVLMAALVLATAVLSNYAQYRFPDTFTLPQFRHGSAPFLGMSGVLYGLFGYVWLRGNMDPSFGARLAPDSVMIMLGWLVLCATNVLGPIANTAHVAGLVVGMAFAFVELQLNQRRR